MERVISTSFETNVNSYICLLIKCQNLKDRLEILCKNKLLEKNKKLTKKIISTNLKLNKLIYESSKIREVINFQLCLNDSGEVVLS